MEPTRISPKKALRIDPLKRAAKVPLHTSKPVAKFAPLGQSHVSPDPKTRKVKTEKQAPSSNLKLPVHKEPDARKSSPVARDIFTCKKRPDSKKAARHKGGGGSKKFVPWCG